MASTKLSIESIVRSDLKKQARGVQFCRDIFARILRDLDAGRALFSDLNNRPTSLRDSATLRELRYARWPSARIFFCERHAEIPEVLQFFREIFAQILRDLDARRALFRVYITFKV